VSLLNKYQKLVKQIKKMQRTHHNKISKKYQKNNAMTASHDSNDADFILHLFKYSTVNFDHFLL
jgi:hypothetical protein